MPREPMPTPVRYTPPKRKGGDGARVVANREPMPTPIPFTKKPRDAARKPRLVRVSDGQPLEPATPKKLVPMTEVRDRQRRDEEAITTSQQTGGSLLTQLAQPDNAYPNPLAEASAAVETQARQRAMIRAGNFSGPAMLPPAPPPGQADPQRVGGFPVPMQTPDEQPPATNLTRNEYGQQVVGRAPEVPFDQLKREGDAVMLAHTYPQLADRNLGITVAQVDAVTPKQSSEFLDYAQRSGASEPMLKQLREDPVLLAGLTAQRLANPGGTIKDPGPEVIDLREEVAKAPQRLAGGVIQGAVVEPAASIASAAGWFDAAKQIRKDSARLPLTRSLSEVQPGGREDAGGAAGFAGKSIGSVLPSGVALFSSGGGSAPVLAYYAVQGFGGGREDYHETLKAQGHDPKLINELAVATGYALTEVLFEKLGLEGIGRIGAKTAGELGQRVLKGEGANKIAKTLIGYEAMSQVEGAEEAATQVTQNFIASFYDPDRPISEGVGEAYLGGLIGGKALGGAAMLSPQGRQAYRDAASAVPESERQQAQQELDQRQAEQARRDLGPQLIDKDLPDLVAEGQRRQDQRGTQPDIPAPAEAPQTPATPVQTAPEPRPIPARTDNPAPTAAPKRPAGAQAPNAASATGRPQRGGTTPPPMRPAGEAVELTPATGTRMRGSWVTAIPAGVTDRQLGEAGAVRVGPKDGRRWFVSRGKLDTFREAIGVPVQDAPPEVSTEAADAPAAPVPSPEAPAATANVAPNAEPDMRPAHKMTDAEREAEAARLRRDEAATLSTPLMSEGAISPTQINRMGKAERERWRRNTMRRMNIEQRLRDLADPESSRRAADDQQLRQDRGRVMVLRRRIEDLSRVGVGKTGKIRPKYQREIDAARAELDEIFSKNPALAGNMEASNEAQANQPDRGPTDQRRRPADGQTDAQGGGRAEAAGLRAAAPADRGQEAPAAGDRRQQRKPRPRKRLSRAEVERRLIANARDSLGLEEVRRLGDLEAIQQQFDGANPDQSLEVSTTFAGPLPTELVTALEGKTHLLSKLRSNKGKGQGEDTLSALGEDGFVTMLEAAHRSELEQAKELARGATDFDPAAAFYAHLLDNWPRQDAGFQTETIAKPDEALNPGDTFTIFGDAYAVEERDGFKVLFDADGEPVTYLAALDDLPADVGSIERAGQVDDTTAARIADDPLGDAGELVNLTARELRRRARALGIADPPAGKAELIEAIQEHAGQQRDARTDIAAETDDADPERGGPSNIDRYRAGFVQAEAFWSLASIPAGAVQGGKRLIDWWSRPLIRNVETSGGKVGPQVAHLARKANDEARRIVGRLSDRLVRLQRNASGKSIASQRAVGELTGIEWVNGKSYGFARFQSAVEGNTPASSLKPLSVRIVNDYRRLVRATGILAERAGVLVVDRPNVNRVQVGSDPTLYGDRPVMETRRPAAGGAPVDLFGDPTTAYRPFKASRDGALLIRRPTADLWDILRSGESTRAFHKLSEALADANGIPGSVAFRELGAMRDRATTRRAAFETSRVFKRFPTHIRVAGEVIELLHAEPYRAGVALVQSTAQRLGFIEAFGQDLPRAGKPSLAQRMAEKYVAAGGNRKDVEDLYRALHGIPIHDRMIEPGTPLHEAARWANAGLGLIRTGLLTRAAIPNMPESFAKVPAFAGLGRYFRGWAYLARHPRSAAIETARHGARTIEVMRLTADPKAKRETFVRLVRDVGLRAVGHIPMNELNELQAAVTGVIMANDLKAGRGTVYDRVRLRLMGFTDSETEQLIAGQAPPELYRAVVTRLPEVTQGSTSSTAERSRAAASPAYRFAVSFDSFSQFTTDRLARINRELFAALKNARAKPKEAKAALKVAAEFYAGSTASGAVAVLLRALAVGGVAGLLMKLDELEDEPAEFAAESLKYTLLGGPTEAAWRAVSDDSRAWYESILGLSLPVSTIKEVVDLAQARGRYRDRTWLERSQRFLESHVTVSRPVRTWAAVMGLAANDEKLDAAISGYWDWRREHKPIDKFEKREWDEDHHRFRIHLRRAVDAMRDGLDPQEHLGAALQVDGKDVRSVRASLRGRMLLRRLDEAEVESLKASVPAWAFEKIEAYDALLEAWAEAARQ